MIHPELLDEVKLSAHPSILTEYIGPHFTKYHLNHASLPQHLQMPWPFRPVIHHLRSPDPDPRPHSHPWDFTSHILKGWYNTEEFGPPDSRDMVELWLGDTYIEGQVYSIKADTIHRITEVSPGGCWTLCFYGLPVKRPVRNFKIAPETNP